MFYQPVLFSYDYIVYYSLTKLLVFLDDHLKALQSVSEMNCAASAAPIDPF